MTKTTERKLPLFYKNPQALTLEEHGKLCVAPSGNMEFAKNANSIPLVVSEFGMASKFYPIVFLKNDVKTSLIVTGMRTNENVFLSSDKKWRADAYVPGYVNRYPFIFFEDEVNNQLVLCVDRDSDMVVENNGTPLFEGDKPSEFSQQALKVCSEYQQHLGLTRNYVEALEEEGLLVENQAELTSPDGKKLKLEGFSVIDEDKFKALPEKTIVDWHKKGWMYLSYAHLISMSNWSNIAKLTGSEEISDREIKN